MKSIAFREVEPSDLVFIEKTYLDSTRNSHAAGMGPKIPWDPLHEGKGHDERELPIWRAILRRPGVRGAVAHKPGEDPECRADIYGYLLYEEGYEEHKTGEALPYVVFLYIKSDYRKKLFRVEEQLFSFAGIDPTKTFHWGVKTPPIARNPLFRAGSHRPLHLKHPPSKTSPESSQ